MTAIIRRAAAATALALAVPHECGAAAGADHLTNGCAPLATVLRLAMAEYGESAAFVAAAANGVVVTLTVNPRTGTWTMWGEKDADTACLLTGGEGWQEAPAAVKNLAPPGLPS
jgi:hypothetical protein